MSNDTWDKTLKIGDVVTCHYQGFYKIIDVVPRHTHNPLVHLQLIANSKGKLINSKRIRECDIGYCQKAYLTINQEMDQLAQQVSQLNNLRMMIVKGTL